MSVGTRGHGKHRAERVRPRRRYRRWTSTLATAAVTVGLGAVALPATAAQASGDDVAAWHPGWSWTYAQTFKYNDGSDTHVTLTENVTYTVTGTNTFHHQSAYKLSLDGQITGGTGSAEGHKLSDFSGTVSGSEQIRRSDLALLQEDQTQSLNAKAKVVFNVNVSADVHLILTPDPGWRTLDFPLNAGNSWHENETIDYSGAYTYHAPVIGSGGSDLNGSFPFHADASVSHATFDVPIGAVSTDKVSATTDDESSQDVQWWAPTYKNVAKEHLKLPLNGASATLDRSLSAAHTPAPGTAVSETINPSLSCAGGPVTVHGTLSSHAIGKSVAVTLDESAYKEGTEQSKTTTTTSGGAYSATLTAPTVSDGSNKNGSRGNYGVLVDANGASNAATLVVTHQDCSAIAYTGDTSAAIGTDATVSAQLTDYAQSSGAAGRTVTFSLSGGKSATAKTNAAGVATASLPVTGMARSATITASYAGSGSLASASDSTTFTVGADFTSATITASDSTPTVGDPVTFTATVLSDIGSGPTGPVQFYVDGATFGDPVPLSGGKATSAPISTLSVGDHTAKAVYLGSTTYAASTSDPVSVHVHKPYPSTTTTLTADPVRSVYGQPVDLTATVTSGTGTPTGAVSFTDGDSTLGTADLDNGQASITASHLSVDTHAIVAHYAGDDGHAPSESKPAGVTVGKADTTSALSSSADSPVTGQQITYSVTVAAKAPGEGTPTGTAQLTIDGAPSGDPVSVDGGAATFDPVTLTAGTHTIAVNYSGDDHFTGSSGRLSQDVAPAATATTVVSDTNPSYDGQDVTFTATVAAQAPGSGDPTGTVTFTSDGSPIGGATLASTPDGDQASITVSTLPVGGHSIVAHYAGDSNDTASKSEALTQTVIKGTAMAPTTTALTSSQNPSTYGEPVTFTATVSADDSEAGTPQGSVQFAVDGKNLAGPVALNDSGTATSPAIGSLEPGDHTITAEYDPAVGFAGGGDLLTQTVNAGGTTVAVSSSSPTSDFGQQVTFSATVTSNQDGAGTPTGTVQFTADGKPLGDPVELSGGRASSKPVATLTPGTHEVAAVYSGDAHFLGDSDSLTQTVNLAATSVTLSSDHNPSTYGENVTFTAKITPGSDDLGAPAGTVTFTDGDTVLGTVPVSGNDGAGSARLTTSKLDAGEHPITAHYSGSDTFAAADSAVLTQHVGKATPTLVARTALVHFRPFYRPLAHLQATLFVGDRSHRVAGKTLTFKIGRTTVCTGVTNDIGTVNCNARGRLLRLLLHRGYDVYFAGDKNYAPAHDHAKLIRF
jgi:hypothetical protein